MAKITFVSVDYEEELPVFETSVIVHLDNNQVIFLSLDSKADDPAYVVFRGKKPLPEPKTDGNSIYWPDGPRLTFDEIIEMLREDGGGKGGTKT
jgi:hypothetical protein